MLLIRIEVIAHVGSPLRKDSVFLHANLCVLSGAEQEDGNADLFAVFPAQNVAAQGNRFIDPAVCRPVRLISRILDAAFHIPAEARLAGGTAGFQRRVGIKAAMKQRTGFPLAPAQQEARPQQGDRTTSEFL